MCGIAGILHFDASRRADEDRLKRMTRVLAHRGPDGEGYYCYNNLGFGHRRLSIIDLSTGDQPMFNDDKSIAIVFNGEIYNYMELREELRKEGCTFRTSSDTEAIIRAYEKWGIDCQHKLNGMWAFTIWDEKKKQLFISRDRMGEKPLYYSTHDSTFVFGSEIKSLAAWGVPKVPNLEMTELYLTLGYMPAPYTYYKNILKLKAGHYLLVADNSVKEHKYWDIPDIEEDRMIEDKKQVYARFEAFLRDSVSIRMRSDVPYGAFLSGGLDSAAVVALMSEISKEPVRTFTIGFKEKAFDETKLAAQVATKFRTDHHQYRIEHQSFGQGIDLIMKCFDEPFGDSSALPTGEVSRIAVENVKMVLTGDGGDEVLSGYNSNLVEKFASRYQQIPSVLRKPVPKLVAASASVLKGSARHKANQVSKALLFADMPFKERLMSKSWISPETASQLIGFSEKQVKLSDFLDQFYSSYKVKDPFYRLMLFQLKVLLPDDFLTKVDRMSMAASLETRVPFLDYRLVEFMVHVHRDIKMQGYMRKSVLINTIGKRLPSDLLRAPKKGFSLPLREWFKSKALENELASLCSSDFGLNTKIIRSLIEKNNNGREDYGNLIWMLFVLKRWMDAAGE